MEQMDPAIAPVRSNRVGPALLFGGAGVLLGRTIVLLAGDGRTVLKRWVVQLTVVEMVVDLVTMASAARWWRSRSPRHASLPVRAAAVATLLHAGRVLIFVLGRTGPWVDFDVRPEHRAEHDQRWTWPGVVFAAAMSVLGVVGAAAVWRVRRAAAHGCAGVGLETRR